MKQSDIFSIILVASVGTLAAFFICQALMGDPSKASISFKGLRTEVTSKLVDPDPEVFNSVAINPTVEVYVGDCEDIDQNGILDDSELEECNRLQREETDCDAFDYDKNGIISADELELCELAKEQEDAEEGEGNSGE